MAIRNNRQIQNNQQNVGTQQTHTGTLYHQQATEQSSQGRPFGQPFYSPSGQQPGQPSGQQPWQVPQGQPGGQQAFGAFTPRALTPAQLQAAFEGTKEADTKLLFSKFPKIQVPGIHLIEVQNVKLVPGTKTVGIYYIVEFKVIRTNVPESVFEGNSYSWSNNLSHPIFGKANMKQFLGAIQGFTAGSPEEQAIDDQDGLESVGPDQPCTGMQCWVETAPNEKGTFTRHRFWCID